MTLQEITDLRQRCLEGTATDEEIRACIEAIRKSRSAAGGTAKGPRKAKGETTSLTLEELESL